MRSHAKPLCAITKNQNVRVEITKTQALQFWPIRTEHKCDTEMGKNARMQAANSRSNMLAKAQ